MKHKTIALMLILITTLILLGCTQIETDEYVNKIDSNLPSGVDVNNNLGQFDSQQEYIEKIMTFEAQRFEVVEELNEKFGDKDNLSFDSIVIYLDKYGVGFCRVFEKEENKSFCENYYPDLEAINGKPNINLCEYITSLEERQNCIDKMIILENTINYFSKYKEDVNSAHNKISLSLKEFDFSNCSKVSEKNKVYCIQPFEAVKEGVYGLKYHFLGWVKYE